MTWVQSQYPCHRRRWLTSTSLMSVCFLWHTHVCLPPHCQNTYLQINNKCNQKYFLSLLQEEENRQRLRVTFKLCYIIHTFIACLLSSSAELACFLGLSKEIAIIFDAWINRNISFHIPRGQRSKVKAWTGPWELSQLFLAHSSPLSSCGHVAFLPGSLCISDSLSFPL